MTPVAAVVRGDRPRPPAELARRLGLEPEPPLLHTALSHPSVVAGAETTRGHSRRARTLLSNQRLEFLGDAVLGLVIAEYLYAAAPHDPEGVLTRRKAAIVAGRTLARAARRCELQDYIILGPGAALTQPNDKILADALEALIGAVFLAGGHDSARALVVRLLGPELDAVTEDENFKGRLQEWAQAAGLGTPNYVTVEISPDEQHRLFRSAVHWQGEERGRGEGATKRAAEMQAAGAALRAAGLLQEL